MARVWAAAHHPPKEVRASACMICMFRDMGALQIIGIPVVISNEGRKKPVKAAGFTGSSPAKEIRMEKVKLI